MDTSVRLDVDVLPVKPLDRSTSIACPAEVKPLDVAAMLRESIDASGLQLKACAYAAGYQPDYWTRVLDGERGLQLDRLGKLPETVQQGLVARWARQLRMRVSTEDEQRAAVAELVLAAVRVLSQAG